MTAELNDFCREIVQNESLYILQETENQFAHCQSHSFETDEGHPCVCLCLWSNESSAKANQIDDWKNYRLSAISLGEFAENWCFGMNENSMVAGLNFDENLNGAEVKALDLLTELVDAILKSEKKTPLKSFNSWEDVKDHAFYLKNE